MTIILENTMISKEALLKHIDLLPDEISIDELIDKLIFIEKLEQRIKESDLNKTVTHEEVVKDAKTWQK